MLTTTAALWDENCCFCACFGPKLHMLSYQVFALGFPVRLGLISLRLNDTIGSCCRRLLLVQSMLRTFSMDWPPKSPGILRSGVFLSTTQNTQLDTSGNPPSPLWGRRSLAPPPQKPPETY